MQGKRQMGKNIISVDKPIHISNIAHLRKGRDGQLPRPARVGFSELAGKDASKVKVGNT
jgi:ribosomal protein L24